jgi:hypothetical protein
MAGLMKIQVFWVVTLCELEIVAVVAEDCPASIFMSSIPLFLCCWSQQLEAG